jgi:hypothetical protein
MATSFASPLCVSTFHIAKWRSKTMVLPSYEIAGHKHRPLVNFVS